MGVVLEGSFSETLRLELLQSDLEAVMKPAASENTQDDLPSVSNDLDGDVDESKAKSLPLPANGLGREHQQGEPRLQVGGQASAAKKGGVRDGTRGRHAEA